MTGGAVNRAVNLVTQTIIKAADPFIPKSSGHLRKHSRPWWYDDCQLTKKKQKAWGIFCRYLFTANYIIYKQA